MGDPIHISFSVLPPIDPRKVVLQIILGYCHEITPQNDDESNLPPAIHSLPIKTADRWYYSSVLMRVTLITQCLRDQPRKKIFFFCLRSAGLLIQYFPAKNFYFKFFKAFVSSFWLFWHRFGYYWPDADHLRKVFYLFLPARFYLLLCYCYPPPVWLKNYTRILVFFCFLIAFYKF